MAKGPGWAANANLTAGWTLSTLGSPQNRLRDPGPRPAPLTTGNTVSSEVNDPPQPKKPCILKPAVLVDQAYLETPADVDAFVAKLRAELNAALGRGERIEIR